MSVLGSEDLQRERATADVSEIAKPGQGEKEGLLALSEEPARGYCPF